jgi:hypothetical protein
MHLRVLVRSNAPDRAVLVERYIDAYLTTGTVSVWRALERLCRAIHYEEVERRGGENWSFAKEYVLGWPSSNPGSAVDLALSKGLHKSCQGTGLFVS